MTACSSKLDSESDKARLLSDCVILTQTFSGSIQTGVIKQFEDLLTRAVRQIWGRDYTIEVKFEHKGNSFWADFYVTLPNGRRVNISNGEGGGLKDLCSVLNRILYLVLDPTQPARVMLMDENLSNLDMIRSPYAFELLARITKELGIQVVWVSHAAIWSDTEVSFPEGVRRLTFKNENNATIVEEGNEKQLEQSK